EKVGLRLAMRQNWGAFIAEKLPQYGDLLRHMAVLGHKAKGRAPISIDEWQAAQLYQVLAFVREE
ncbi:hypothetical protein GUF51_03935, partial [Xanthomonas citri pv. citri]|nr:hypothetical protein [Xanthomonas citri pv. citri]